MRCARLRRAADARPAGRDSSTISRCSGTGRRGEREGGAVHDDCAGSVPRVRRARRRRCSRRASDGDAQPAHRSRSGSDRRHRASTADGDGRDDGRDQTRRRSSTASRRRRGGEKPDRRRRRVVETPPQREQVQRHPLGLRDVRVIGGLREVERGERVRQSRRRSRPPARAPDGAQAGTRAAADRGKLRRTSQLYAATPPETRASSAPVMSVTGCEYTPMVIGRSNCAITVKGSWWRPTISMPNTRSDGARRTGGGDRDRDDRGQGRDRDDFSGAAGQHAPPSRRSGPGPGNRPGADVAHVRRQAGVTGEGVQREQALPSA